MARSTYDIYQRSKRKCVIKRLEILTAILGVLLVCCAYAGKVDPRSFVLAPFMTLAYVPMLVLAAVWLLFAAFKRRWIAVTTLVVALLATAPVFKLFVPLNTSASVPPEPANRDMMLKVMTYNVLAFNYGDPLLGDQPSETMKLILDADPDVLLMQEGTASGADWDEMPSLAGFLNEIQMRYPYRYNSSEGLSIMSKFPFDTQPLGEPQHARSPLGYNRNNTSHLARAYDLHMPNGKQLRLVDFRFQSYHLSFGKSMNVRVSPDVKPSALERMRRSFALRGDNAAAIRKAIDESPGNVIVCGDMNDVSGSHVYRVICGDDLHDAWSEVGSGYAYTYNSHKLLYRIDHVLYRGAIKALKAQRYKGGSSDHYPLMVTFDLDVRDKK